MPASAFTAIATLEVVYLREDLVTLLAVVEVLGFQFIIVKLHQRFCFNISQIYGPDHPLHLSFNFQRPGDLAVYHIEGARVAVGFSSAPP